MYREYKDKTKGTLRVYFFIGEDGKPKVIFDALKYVGNTVGFPLHASHGAMEFWFFSP